jgi:hypothetical protein
MKITKGKQTRAQRVVIYGVESVGKSTFAAKFPKPLFLDVENGSNSINVLRWELETKPDRKIELWNELKAAIIATKDEPQKTIVIDSADRVENIIREAICEQYKKTSIEDFGYGKGEVIVAEWLSRLLSSLDELIYCGKNVVIIAHSHVKPTQPPDMMASYDRYELRMSKKCSPLVKEWADELWFLRFKTKVVSTDSGKGKGIGGKERILLTTHSAAYDAKTRSGLAEELPLEWASVAHLFETTAQAVVAPTATPPESWAGRLAEHEGAVNQFLIGRGVLTSEQTWRDCAPEYLHRVALRVDQFVNTAIEWRKANQ